MCSFDEQKAEALVYILGVGEDEDNDWVCIDARIDDGETRRRRF